MSKKIIYLLSLLMALSLVFASCKKNGITDALGGAPVDVPDPITPPDGLGGDGLYDSWDELAKKNNAPVQRTPVWKYDGDYSRNPVIVTLGNDANAVLIVSEKRYKKAGAANDIGVDGSTVVDIQWALSINAGKSFDTGEYQQGVIHTAGNDPTQARGAPVVFKVADDKVVVVASAGAAISRTDQPYSQRKITTPSKIYYTVGTMQGSSMNWTQWREIENVQAAVEGVNSTLVNTPKFEQFGTHSARGFTTSDKTMLLAVVMAIQGTNGEANYKEAMGYLLVSGKLNTDDSTVAWTVNKGNAYAFPQGGDGTKYSKHKEARIIGGTASSPQYIVVPNGRATLQLAVGNGFTSAPNYSITGGDGSVGSVTVDKWFGANQYDPSNLTSTTVVSPQPQAILSHVAGIEKNLKIYLMKNDFSGQKASTVPYSVTSESKSSSIDVLGDGTIVSAAEEGLANSSIKYSYVINFTRYTQYFLATKTTATK